jgi:hypothetical protein
MDSPQQGGGNSDPPSVACVEAPVSSARKSGGPLTKRLSVRQEWWTSVSANALRRPRSQFLFQRCHFHWLCNNPECLRCGLRPCTQTTRTARAITGCPRSRIFGSRLSCMPASARPQPTINGSAALSPSTSIPIRFTFGTVVSCARQSFGEFLAKRSSYMITRIGTSSFIQRIDLLMPSSGQISPLFAGRSARDNHEGTKEANLEQRYSGEAPLLKRSKPAARPESKLDQRMSRRDIPTGAPTI